MFTVTINGNTIKELFDNLEAFYKSEPGAALLNYQPEPIPATALGAVPVAQNPTNPPPTVAPTCAATSTLPQPVTPASVVPAAANVPTPQVPETTTPTPATTANTAAVAGVPIAAPTYTLDQLARAGAALAQAGKMQEALALLAKYGVQTVNQLKPEQYGAFATELRALGAQV